MEALIVVLLLVLIAAIAGVAAITWNRGNQREEPEETDKQQLAREIAMLKSELTQAVTSSHQSTRQTLLGQVNALDQKINQRLDAVQTSVGQSLTATTETIGKIGQQLGGLSEATKHILEVGQDVSSLKDILQPPKLRGGFGEMLLEQLVKQVLASEQYSTQHRFNDNTIVDLVIQSPEGLVPVDSKFPIESFRRLLLTETDEDRTRARKAFVRDVKLRIDETAKYIRPDDGTLDFALMYVPAENIYYETIAGSEDESAMTYALERNVHLVSPNTFHAFLQVVLRGFNGLKVQEDAKEIMTRLALFRREFAKFNDDFRVLGNHLGHAKSKHDELTNASGRLADRLEIEVPVQNSLLEPVAEESEVPEPLRLRIGDDA